LRTLSYALAVIGSLWAAVAIGIGFAYSASALNRGSPIEPNSRPKAITMAQAVEGSTSLESLKRTCSILASDHDHAFQRTHDLHRMMERSLSMGGIALFAMGLATSIICLFAWSKVRTSPTSNPKSTS
jgi:hypothetical protein